LGANTRGHTNQKELSMPVLTAKVSKPDVFREVWGESFDGSGKRFLRRDDVQGMNIDDLMMGDCYHMQLEGRQILYL
jgi:hypothetical protein